MFANKLIDCSCALEIDASRKLCNVKVPGLEYGTILCKIIDLNARVIVEKSIALNHQNSFSIQLGDIVPGRYILSISSESEGTRHLKLVV
jgi:hypothetical protein